MTPDTLPLINAGATALRLPHAVGTGHVIASGLFRQFDPTFLSSIANDGSRRVVSAYYPRRAISVGSDRLKEQPH